MCITTKVLSALCELFHDYASRQVQWKSLFIFSDGQEEDECDTMLLYHALRIANEASLFASMELDFCWNLSFRNRIALWILPSLAENCQLMTNLSLSLDLDLSINDSESLCRNLSDSTSLTDLALEIPGIGEYCICKALASNTTLNMVSLSV